MIYVYVKHYLNSDGIDFFENNWFPRVKSAITLQEGFVSINAEKESNNSACINIIVKFEDREKLMDWVETEIHDELVDALDPYRIQNWKVSIIEKNTDDGVLPSEIIWELVIPKYVAYEAIE